jgi:hypothetical protein
MLLSVAKSDPAVARSTWVLIALLCSGVALRLVWLFWWSGNSVSASVISESLNAARSFSRTGQIADAYYEGQGPTAHVMPVMPIIVGSVYKFFGVATPQSEVILTFWSLTLAMASFWLLFASFGELESPLLSRFAALTILCVAPLNFLLETVDFKVWEGGLGVALASGYLLWVMRLDKQPLITNAAVGVTGLSAAAVLLVSPPLGLAAYSCCLLLLVRKFKRQRWPAALAIVLVATGAVMTPWTVRNIQVLHRPIFLRDNFGLELELANHPGALESTDEQAEFLHHFEETHPMRPAGKDAMIKAGGEVAYSEKLGAEARAWIGSNPVSFARLAVRHLIEFLFPPRWYWSQFGGNESSRTTGPKMAVHWILSALGIFGIVYGVFRVNYRYLYPAAMTSIPVIPYIFVQPTLRYRYIIFGLLVFLSCDFVVRIAARITAPANRTLRYGRVRCRLADRAAAKSGGARTKCQATPKDLDVYFAFDALSGDH